MLHGTTIRALAASTASALVLAGCGIGGGAPVVSSQDEVVDAVLALRDGARARGTAELTVDEDELRAALLDDPDALALLRELAQTEGVEDTDELLAELSAAQAQLARQAVLLEVGADGSARVAAEQDGTVWADLRVRGDAVDDADLTQGASIDVQLQVDWETAATVLEQPDLRAQLDDAIAAVRGFGSAPELRAVTQLATAFLTGELVGISGPLTPELLGPLGSDGRLPGSGALDVRAELDPRELLTTAFTFDGFRRDGDDTLVTVTLELRAVGELVLDVLDDHTSAAMSFEELEEARAELARLPERLDDVATLRLDDAGTISSVRIDLLDLGLQLARSTDEQEQDLATATRLAEQLDGTGLFLLLDVTDVGTTPSVLGQPTTSVTPEQLAEAVGALFLGAFGDLAAQVDDLAAQADDLAAQADASGDLEG